MYFALHVLGLTLLAALRGKSAASDELIRVRKLSPVEVAATRTRLSRPVEARAAGAFEIDPRRVFALERGGKVWMVVEPVRYDSYDTEVPTHTSFRCGVFFLAAEGVVAFVPTIGYGNYEPVQCTALRAVRFKYPKGRYAPPRIEISYTGDTPHTTSEQYVVLSWSVAKKAYVEDEAVGVGGDPARLRGDESRPRALTPGHK